MTLTDSVAAIPCTINRRTVRGRGELRRVAAKDHFLDRAGRGDEFMDRSDRNLGGTSTAVVRPTGTDFEKCARIPPGPNVCLASHYDRIALMARGKCDEDRRHR